MDTYLEYGHAVTLAFNHRGTMLAAGRADGHCIIWDFDTRSVARDLAGHAALVRSVRCVRMRADSLGGSVCLTREVGGWHGRSQLVTQRATGCDWRRRRQVYPLGPPPPGRDRCALEPHRGARLWRRGAGRHAPKKKVGASHSLPPPTPRASRRGEGLGEEGGTVLRVSARCTSHAHRLDFVVGLAQEAPVYVEVQLNGSAPPTVTKTPFTYAAAALEGSVAPIQPSPPCVLAFDGTGQRLYVGDRVGHLFICDVATRTVRFHASRIRRKHTTRAHRCSAAVARMGAYLCI